MQCIIRIHLCERNGKLSFDGPADILGLSNGFLAITDNKKLRWLTNKSKNRMQFKTLQDLRLLWSEAARGVRAVSWIGWGGGWRYLHAEGVQWAARHDSLSFQQIYDWILLMDGFREKTLSSYRWARNAGPGAKMGRGTWRGGTTRSGTWPSWLFWQILTTGRSCQSQGTLPTVLERCMSLTEDFTRWVPLAFDKSPDSWLVSKVLIVDLVSGSQSAAGYLGSEVFQIIC